MLLYLTTFVFVFAVLFFFLCLFFKRFEERSLELDLYLKGDQLEDTLESSPPSRWERIIDSFPAHVVQLFEGKGGKLRLLVGKPPSFPALVGWRDIPRLSGAQESSMVERCVDGTCYKTIILRLSAAGKTPVRVVAVAFSMAPIYRSLKHLILIGVAFIPAMCLLVFAASTFVVGASLSPIREVIETARSITAEDLSKRLPEVKTGDEMEQLVATFNMMLSNLEASFRSLKQFTSNAAHEFKTPLSILRSNVEVLLKEDECSRFREQLLSMKEQVERLIRLVDGLLLLSRIEASVEVLKEGVALDILVLELFERFLPVAQAKGVEFALGRVDAVKVKGNSELLFAALSNLIDNAVKYTPSGGRVEVSLYLKGDGAVFEVSDTGLGIPADEMDRVFDPLFRGKASSASGVPGVGLGLTVAKRILDLHMARIEVKSRPGGGTTFRVLFKKAEAV